MKKPKYTLQIIILILLLIYPKITLANPSSFIKSSSELKFLKPTCKLSEKKQPNYFAQRRDNRDNIVSCWKFTYSVDGILHETVLWLNGRQGKALTTFFNPKIQRTDYVEQTITVTNSSHGVLIVGSNPVYPNTNRKHPSYSPDIILLQIRPNGETVVVNCDENGRCSAIDFEDCPLN